MIRAVTPGSSSRPFGLRCEYVHGSRGLERSIAHGRINITSRRSGNASRREWNIWATGNHDPCLACETSSRFTACARLVSPREAWQPLAHLTPKLLRAGDVKHPTRVEFKFRDDDDDDDRTAMSIPAIFHLTYGRIFARELRLKTVSPFAQSRTTGDVVKITRKETLLVFELKRGEWDLQESFSCLVNGEDFFEFYCLMNLIAKQVHWSGPKDLMSQFVCPVQKGKSCFA